MDINEYVLARLVSEKLETARAHTARRALLVSVRPSRVPLRARLGRALIALGERLGGVPAPRPSCASHG